MLGDKRLVWQLCCWSGLVYLGFCRALACPFFAAVISAEEVRGFKLRKPVIRQKEPSEVVMQQLQVSTRERGDETTRKHVRSFGRSQASRVEFADDEE